MSGRPPAAGSPATFITRLAGDGRGPRLAVKDCIDMAGVPTTAGCRAVATVAEPARRDAACLAGARAADARIVGRTNLHELAFGVTGVNPWYGTPVNPLDPTLVPGGSSSGSAVAVATGEADVAYGTDTGGSIRIPSACCGTVGLKTTWGRVPLDGVWPLAPSLDTVGPMAADVTGVILGMRLLEPGFRPAAVPDRVGRVRVGCSADIDRAVDRALRLAGWEVVDVPVPDWGELGAAASVVLVAEAWRSNRRLVERDPAGIGRDVLDRLRLGHQTAPDTLSDARRAGRRWRDRLRAVFGDVALLATPVLTIPPPRLEAGDALLAPTARCTLPANLGGVPALALPVPTPGGVPASLQLMGPAGSEEVLVTAGLAVEEALVAEGRQTPT